MPKPSLPLFPALLPALLFAALFAASPAAAGDSPLIGTWADARGENVYRFTRAGEFRHYRKLGESPPLPGESASGRPVVSWSRTAGVYRTGGKACSQGKVRGNLLVLGDGFRACVRTSFVGGRLSLAGVYERGDGDTGLASDALLERIYEMPRGIPEE